MKNTIAMKRKIISVILLAAVYATLSTGCAAKHLAPPPPPPAPPAPGR